MAFWIPIIIAVAAAAASYLLTPKPKSSGILDDATTEPSVRGTIAPFILGRFKTGPVSAYIGSRLVREERVDYHKDAPKQAVYYEKAIHVLCVGPARRLNTIYEGGKEIFKGPITPLTHPSGTQVDLGYGRNGYGRFRIYWGEPDQPVDSGTASITGLRSRFPYICYIAWDHKRLGTQSTWPSLEYDIEVDTLSKPVGGEYIEYSAFSITENAVYEGDLALSGLAGYSSIFGRDDTTSFAFRLTASSVADAQIGNVFLIESINYIGTVTNIFSNGADFLVFSNSYLPQSEVGNTRSARIYSPEGRGVNPASALHQMLFETYPHGLGLSPPLFDTDSLKVLADMFKNEEPSPCSLVLKAGKSFRDGIDAILQDFGLFFYWNQNTGIYGFSALREGDSSTTISLSNYKTGELARVSAYAVLDSDKTIYSFKDSSRKFTDSTITITDDGKAQYSDNPNAKKVPLNTITDLATASMVVGRREQESSLNEALSVSLSGEGMSNLVPGQLIELEGLSAKYRLLEITIDPDDSEVKAGLMLDVYSPTKDYEQQK